ncbi:MAG: hypothetical protein FWF02_09855 [Micrococcales bacterium]|nr:hypothetical protein [Micrococcales bacterium]
MRTISSALAPVLAELELDQPLVVTLADLESVLARTGHTNPASAAKVAYELQRRGWLGTLRTQGSWEFYPAARAGAFGSGDRFVELRALRRRDPLWPGVLAMESAASVLGLAQRLPSAEVIALPRGVRAPDALGAWRTVRTTIPVVGTTTVSDLPTWNLEALLAGIASRPSNYRDLPGMAQWLPTITPDLPRLHQCLTGATNAARQRTAYLLSIAGLQEAARELVSARPRQTAWFGPRRPGGHYDHPSGVIDTLLAPYLTTTAAA